MKYIFKINHHSQLLFFVHKFQDCKIQKISNDYNLSISNDTDTFIISHNDHFLNKPYSNCKKIALRHNFCLISEKNIPYDCTICISPGEPHHTDLEVLKVWLDNNIYIHGSKMEFEHENMIFDPFWHLAYFYHLYNFNSLTFYTTKEKENLLGTYHKSVHSSGRDVTDREYIFQACKKILEEQLIIYHSSDYKMKEVIEPYTYLGTWEKNHISSYTDYSTSACNLIFETFPPHRERNSYLSEKTLKALLFGKANIFFIWYGTDYWFKLLSKNGFWFLNSEFYDHKNPNSMNDSVIATVEYLKKLKNQFKTNNDVYNHLLTIYGHKLDNNVSLLNSILEGNDPYSQFALSNFLAQLKKLF